MVGVLHHAVVIVMCKVYASQFLGCLGRATGLEPYANSRK